MASSWSTFDYTQVQGIPEVALRIELLHDRLQSLSNGNQPRILEVGIGSGDVTLMLAQQYQDVTCVDAETENCERVLERLKDHNLSHVEIIHSTVEDAELPAEAYDHIVLLGILEHLKDPVDVLKCLAPCLRPGGCMHITVNLANSLHRLLGEAMGVIAHVEEISESDIRLGHYRVYTLPQLREHVASSGLQVAHEHPFYLKPLPTSMLTPLSMEVHRGLNALGQKYPEFASYIYMEVQSPPTGE